METLIEREQKLVTDLILDQYVKIILDETGIDVRHKGRQREVVDLRRIFSKHAKYNLDFSLTRIAKYLNQTHATILHAAKTYDHLYFRDVNFRARAEFFIERFCSIDGFEREEPNKEDLNLLIECASEKTRGIWLKLIQETEMLRGIATNIELVENE
jgi:hypothetical protein|tara:strand:- start:143 stop:613 length:471 start_codon:yes stop_codon:yes gene_type:complete